jgi:hypothetical protein
MTNRAVRSLSLLQCTLALLALASASCDEPEPARPSAPADAPEMVAPPPGREADPPDAGDDATEPSTIADAAAGGTAPGEASSSALDGDDGGTRAACRTYFRDEDGDGYGSAPLSVCGDAPAPGDAVTEDGDCCDVDANVHPGQHAYFSAPSACGAFDYDCDGTEEPENPDCQLGCGVACLHSFTAAVPPEACR